MLTPVSSKAVSDFDEEEEGEDDDIELDDLVRAAPKAPLYV